MTRVERTTTEAPRRLPPTPADLVTLARGAVVLLAGGLVLAALAAGGGPRTWWVAGLGALAWVGDALDGHVARRTGTASARGAVLDSSVDGALVLVLALAVAPVAPWALLGGLLLPAFVLVQLRRPGWRRPLPPSRRRRLLGGLLTGTLVAACVPLWPPAVVQLALALPVALVAWSFAVDVRWLERAAAGVGSGLH